MRSSAGWRRRGRGRACRRTLPRLRRCRRPRAPPRAEWRELRRTHTTEYLARARGGTLARREQLALGLPWSPELVERARRATGATTQAAEAALDDGAAANLGGGTHHAFPGSGRGFCLFNDVVTALRSLRAR